MFTETWLNNSVPDCTIQLDQLTCYRADRALVEGGKSRGGGLCVYIIDAWCRDAVVVCKHCSPWWSLWLLSAGRSIYRGNIQPYCSLLYTSLPAPTTTTEWGTEWSVTSTSVSSRQPTQMLFSSWLGIWIPCHRLECPLLSLKRWAILLEYCLFASLMPRDRLALAVFRPSSSPALRQRSEPSEVCKTSPVSHGSGWPRQW